MILADLGENPEVSLVPPDPFHPYPVRSASPFGRVGTSNAELG